MGEENRYVFSLRTEDVDFLAVVKARNMAEALHKLREKIDADWKYEGKIEEFAERIADTILKKIPI